jgi:hypothetical protein
MTKVAEQRLPVRYATRDIMPTLRAFALATGASVLLAQPSISAEVFLLCVWQSHGASHERRSFEIAFDKQAQRAQLSGNDSLPAQISDTQLSFAVNLSGSIFQYVVDRTSGFGTLTIRDQVMYSGMCSIANAAHPSIAAPQSPHPLP